MSTSESSWPQARHSLRSPAENYWEFSDLGWQRLSGLDGRTSGFRRAAEMLYEAILASRSIADLDTVFFPYAMCWRHYVELQLKALLADLRALAGRPPQNEHHHKIEPLWLSAKALLREQTPSTNGPELRATDRLIRQMASMDPDGEHFRYAERRDGTATLHDVDRVNLVDFHEAMLGVANFLEAVGMAIDDSLSIKLEMDAYYAAEFGPQWSDFA